MNFDQQRAQYVEAFQAVQSRVRVIRFLNWVKTTHWYVGLIALLGVFCVRMISGWQSGEVWFVLALSLVWVVAGAVKAVSSRLSILEALVLLDRSGGWKDQFSSAWEFLEGKKPAEVEVFHLTKSEQKLPDARKAFPAAMPFPKMGWCCALLAFALIFAASGVGRRSVDIVDQELTDAMQESAAEQSEYLKRENAALAEIEAADEEEAKQLEELRVEVNQVAQDLAEADGLTAGEMLEALEMRARKAERLAEKMDNENEGWASEQMLAEMEKHPDTADLALAIRDEAALPAADEAIKLYSTLDSSEIQRETEDRIDLTLRLIMEAATDKDRQMPVGERFGNALNKMVALQTRTAAREFEELAKHFRLLEKREEAREKLESMAETLREAGGDIANSEMEKQQELARTTGDPGPSREGLQAIDSGEPPADLDSLVNPKLAATDSDQQAGRDSPSQGQIETPGAVMKAPVPGEQEGGISSDQSESSKTAPQMTLSAPIPGESLSPQEAGGDGPANGDESRQGKGDAGQLSAPVPGMEPGDSTPGSGQSLAGNAPSDGRQGGNEAGTASAEMIDSESDVLEPSRDEKVVAQAGFEGSSTVRAVEGEVRQEAALRSRQEVITDFIAAEEQALDGKSLPRSRRDQVIRYFSGIRSQFELSE